MSAWDTFNAGRKRYSSSSITIIPGKGLRLNDGAAAVMGSGPMLFSVDRSNATVRLSRSQPGGGNLINLMPDWRGRLFGEAKALAAFIGIAEKCTIPMKEVKGEYGLELVGALPSKLGCAKCRGADVLWHCPICPRAVGDS